MIPKINELQAKSIFTKSKLPASDWVINPYNGCLFGCLYCYAAQILLKKELATLASKAGPRKQKNRFL